MVAGAIGPLHRRGREGLRVRVTGRGVNGQEHIALAVVAVHLDLATVQPGAVAAPAPFDKDLWFKKGASGASQPSSALHPSHQACKNSCDTNASIALF